MSRSLAVDTREAPRVGTVSLGRWGVVGGALLIQAILGTVYAFSVLVEPFETAFAWSRTQITTTASISLGVFALTMVVAGGVLDRRGPRFTALIGAGFLTTAFLAVSQMRSLAAMYVVHGIVTAAVAVGLYLLINTITGGKRSPVADSMKIGAMIGVAVTSLLVAQGMIKGTSTDSLWMFYLTYGFLGGIGIGFGYVAPVTACVKWFPNHRGLITGIAVAGFGAGSMIFAPSARWTIDALGWSSFFLIHGFVCAAGLSIGALLLRNPSDEDKARLGSVRHAAKEPGEETHWSEMVRTWKFWRLWILFVFGATAGLMTITQLKPFATLQGLTAGQGAAAIAVLAACNAAGRTLWGAASDRIGRSRSMAAMFALQAVMMFAINGFDGPTLFFLAAGWVGFNFGGIFALFPSATADSFGTRGLGTNYGIVFTAYGVAGILGPIVAARVYDATQTYAVAFTFAAILCVAAAVIALFSGRAARRAQTA